MKWSGGFDWWGGGCYEDESVSLSKPASSGAKCNRVKKSFLLTPAMIARARSDDKKL